VTPAQEQTSNAEEKRLELTRDLTLDHSLQDLQLLVTPLTVDELDREAKEWLVHVQDAMMEIASLKIAARSAEGESLERLRAQIKSQSGKRADLVAKFKMIVDSMELKGGDPEVIRTYRQYVSGAMAAELQATDLRTSFRQLLDWSASKDGGIGFLFKAGIVLGSLFLLYLLARLLSATAARGIRRISNLSVLMQEFLLKIVFWLFFAIGLMIFLSLFGVNITPLFAVLGGASFILAFAMQETLGNLAAGLMIMINKPFDVGNLIDTNGIMGEVEAVSIVSTTVRTLDNRLIILPNSKVWGSIITNVTVSSKRRVDLVFGISYGDDIETASKVLEELVARHPLVLDEPEPNIKVHELGDSSVNFICRPWVKTEDYWTVHWDLTRQAKEGLEAAGITIPFPQRDVHLFKESS
jgi:small conductance mechanosensitive channel